MGFTAHRRKLKSQVHQLNFPGTHKFFTSVTTRKSMSIVSEKPVFLQLPHITVDITTSAVRSSPVLLNNGQKKKKKIKTDC